MCKSHLTKTDLRSLLGLYFTFLKQLHCTEEIEMTSISQKQSNKP